MEFVIFQNSQDRDCFIVTDTEHAPTLKARDCCPTGGELEKIGEFVEMGATRVAFDEAHAKRFIATCGYYTFHSKTLDPVAEIPSAMPG